MLRLRIQQLTDEGEVDLGDLVIRGGRVEPAAPSHQLQDILDSTFVYDPDAGRVLTPKDGERYLSKLASTIDRWSSYVAVPVG